MTVTNLHGMSTVQKWSVWSSGGHIFPDIPLIFQILSHNMLFYEIIKIISAMIDVTIVLDELKYERGIN
jgi:hypothetical protein